MKTPFTYIEIASCAALLCAAAPCALVAAGDGTFDNPYTDDEVTSTTLNQGGTEGSPCYNILDDFTSDNFTLYTKAYVGAGKSYNNLIIRNGGILYTNTSYIGEYDGDTGNNVLLVGTGSDDETTLWSCRTGIINGTNAALFVGGCGDENTLTVIGGADMSSLYAFIGYGDNNTAVYGCDNSAVVSGAGSTWAMHLGLNVGLGRGTGNTLTISDGALAELASSSSDIIAIDSGNYVRLANGWLAQNGDQTSIISALLTDGAIQVWDDATASWVAGTSTNVTATYYDTTSATAESDALAATGYSGLAGYTVVTGGDDICAWADASMTARNWYESSWYGDFYCDSDTYGHWIGHATQGWQYVVGSGSAVYIWDDCSQRWWYTSATLWPYFYSFDDAAWFYYMSGETPLRTFWSFPLDEKVTDTDLAASLDSAD